MIDYFKIDQSDLVLKQARNYLLKQGLRKANQERANALR